MENSNNAPKSLENEKNEIQKYIRIIKRQDDDETLEEIFDFDIQTKNLAKQERYQPDGRNLAGIVEYNPKTGNKIKATEYQSDGRTRKEVRDFDPQTGKISKWTWYKDCKLCYRL